MKTQIRILSFIIALVTITVCFTGCAGNKEDVSEVISSAQKVLINGTEVYTVEARMGAFQGKQGDYIEFIFSEPQKINTVHIIEKTTSVRQFNIYADEDGKYKLLHTGKTIFNDTIPVEETETSAIKIVILNTEIGNDNFIIQGITAYNITDKGE